jgi:hypothetical protein
MSGSNEQPEVPRGPSVPGEPEAKAELQPGNHVVNNNDFIEALKQNLHESRLPADLKEQVLAGLPPPEERERLLRELIENGGLSFEEFFGSLLAEFEERS